jgi:hypothetical protein
MPVCYDRSKKFVSNIDTDESPIAMPQNKRFSM